MFCWLGRGVAQRNSGGDEGMDWDLDWDLDWDWDQRVWGMAWSVGVEWHVRVIFGSHCDFG